MIQKQVLAATNVMDLMLVNWFSFTETDPFPAHHATLHRFLKQRLLQLNIEIPRDDRQSGAFAAAKMSIPGKSRNFSTPTRKYRMLPSSGCPTKSSVRKSVSGA